MNCDVTESLIQNEVAKEFVFGMKAYCIYQFREMLEDNELAVATKSYYNILYIIDFSCTFYRQQRKLQEGNVFTRVCLSFCSWGCIPACTWLGVYTPSDTHIPDTYTHIPDTYTHTPSDTTPPEPTPFWMAYWNAFLFKFIISKSLESITTPTGIVHISTPQINHHLWNF